MAAVTMRLGEIGQQLRAFRLESGMRADEIAARLGVSRAALYRYEKGEVIKLDTVQRLAELLKVSPLTLLGIGVEYYSRPLSFFERVRQMEEEADQILQIADPVAYLVTSDAYDSVLTRAIAEQTDDQQLVEQHVAIMASRKELYRQRRPTMITMLSEAAVERFLVRGVGEGMAMDESLQTEARRVAAQEIANIIEMIEAEPIGLQFSLLGDVDSSTNCMLLRGRERMMLAINPFRCDAFPAATTGVSLVTSAPEAVNAHQRVIEVLWKESLKGREAAERLHDLLARHGLR
ncbi:helix-turn-helix domain-containing protein [Acetobacter estunensis]|uniref:helix-turn-helix domain-containing protein n=1 Tax=Acetobacter estunensis TaxID=104097 RepID=UPI001C2D041F|nr:helix-turn-helix transcriptional regulator [Acetobacter estunensis]MBV1837300.1 helix-turn-helix domain-containing protein [Acetobacter estunensis]